MNVWKFISALLLTGLVNVTFAVNAYQIELIVFSQYKADAMSSELWPDVSRDSLNLQGAQALASLNDVGLSHVSSKAYTLKKELQRLTHFAPYQVLLHTAWRETLEEASKKHTFHLYGGNLYDESGNVIQTDTNESLKYSPEQNWELNGTMTIALRHYFEVNFNLLLAIPEVAYDAMLKQLSDNSDGQIFKYFTLNQSRRTRSGELNYVDHPLYGVIFKITPIQEEAVVR